MHLSRDEPCSRRDRRLEDPLEVGGESIRARIARRVCDADLQLIDAPKANKASNSEHCRANGDALLYRERTEVLMTPYGRLALSLAVSMLGIGGRRALAQALLIPAGSNAVQVTAAAEREGTSYRRVSGSSDAAPRTCALPWINAPVKSGEFTIGGQISPAFPLTAGRRGKIWWSPMHNAKDMPPLVIRGRNLTTMKDTVRLTMTSIGYASTGGGVRIPESQRTYFFPSGTTLPTPGRWLLVATSGPNWGCFVLTVTAATPVQFSVWR